MGRVMWRVVVMGLCALALTGCFGTHRRSVKPTRQVLNVKPVPAKIIIKTAKAQIGRSYSYGGSDPSTGFDCSGLVHYCYAEHGSSLPRTAHELYKLGDPVSKGSLQPGDLVFFDTASGGPKPAHVGILVSKGRFIHAPSTGESVREDELINTYWKKAYYGARRIE